MTQEQLLTVLLGGLGGALASWTLQVIYAGRVARGRAVAALRVVRMEIVQNYAVAETVLRGDVPLRGKTSYIRRSAFDALAHEVAPALDDEDLSDLVSFYSLHDGVTSQIRQPASGESRAWLETYLDGAEIAQRVVERAAMPTWALISRWLARRVIHDLRRKYHAAAGPELPPLRGRDG